MTDAEDVRVMRVVTTSDEPLTPFVGALRRDLSAALLRLWGEDRNWDIDFRLHPDGVDARVFLDDNPLTLELRCGSGGDSPAWPVIGGTVRLRVPKGVDPKRSPRLQACVESLARARSQGTLDVSGALRAAAALRPFSQVNDKYYRGIEVTTRGMSAMLRLGFRCNQDCAFCWQGRDWPSPPEELYWTWLDEMAATGVDRITLTGGEPTLYRRLPELVARAHHTLGLCVHMQTNAVQLAKSGYAQGLREAGLEAILVSLHASTAELSDALTRAPGTHRRTLLGIHAAFQAGMKVAFNCLVETANVADLPSLAEFIVEEFATRYPGAVLVVNFSQAGQYHDSRRIEDHYVTVDAVRGPLVAATRRLKEAGVAVESMGTCGFPMCIYHHDADLLPPPRSEVDGQHMSARTTDARACETCTRRGECVGVRLAYLKRFGESGLRPFAD